MKCENHPDRFAKWRCISCKGAFCEECVRKGQLGDEIFIFCKRCQGKCVGLNKKKESRPGLKSSLPGFKASGVSHIKAGKIGIFCIRIAAFLHFLFSLPLLYGAIIKIMGISPMIEIITLPLALGITWGLWELTLALGLWFLKRPIAILALVYQASGLGMGLYNIFNQYKMSQNIIGALLHLILVILLVPGLREPRKIKGIA